MKGTKVDPEVSQSVDRLSPRSLQAIPFIVFSRFHLTD